MDSNTLENMVNLFFLYGWKIKKTKDNEKDHSTSAY